MLRIEEAERRVKIASPVRLTARVAMPPLVLLTVFAVAALAPSVGWGRVMLAACCVSCAASLVMVSYVVWGADVLIADGQWLLLRRELFGVGPTVRVPLAEVPDLSFDQESDDDAVVLYVGSGRRRFHFGGALTSLEQMRLKIALQDHLNRMRPRLR